MRNLKFAIALGVVLILAVAFVFVVKAADKITICHATGSVTNPFTEITINENSLRGHADHSGDIIPAPVGGCNQDGDGGF